MMNTKNNIALFCLVFMLVLALFFSSACSITEPVNTSPITINSANMTGFSHLSLIDIGTKTHAQLESEKANLASPTFTGTVTLPITNLSGDVILSNYSFDAGDTNCFINSSSPFSGLIISSLNNSGQGVNLTLRHSRGIANQNNDYISQMLFQAYNSNNDLTNYGLEYYKIVDASNGTEDSCKYWYLKENGSDNLAMQLNGDGTLYVNGTYETFDDYDDAVTLKRAFSDGEKQVLFDMSILVNVKDKKGNIKTMIDTQKLLSLIAGGVYQNRDKIDLLEKRIAELEARLK